MTKRTRCLKATVAVLSVVLAMLIGIAGTLAYLKDSTDPVVNTFTSSDVSITLVEGASEWDDEDGDTRTNSYKMVPGATINKDPKVTVLADSEACYVFVEVVKSGNFDTYMEYTMAEGWTQVPNVSGVYYRQVSASTADQPFDVLLNNQITVKSTVTKANMQLIDGVGDNDQLAPTLTFTAYAIQSENLNTTDMADIWDMAKGLQG